nr:low temperature requirement protein A [Janthinobacterium sp. 67]
MVHLSTATTQKSSTPPWVKFGSARWVNFRSAPTVPKPNAFLRRNSHWRCCVSTLVRRNAQYKYFEPNRRATWLELFFDLIFVVAIGDVTHILNHTHEGHLAPLQFWQYVLAFIPLWWIWVSHTMYANRFDADDRKHRLATLFIMFLVIIISGLIDQRFLASFDAIIVCYACSKYIIAIMYFVSKHRHKESAQLTTAVGWVSLAGATISLASILFPPPQRYVVLYLGILFDLVAFVFFLPRRLQGIPVHTEHLIERVGLLTLILLGESVISLSTGLANISWTMEGSVALAYRRWPIR